MNRKARFAAPGLTLALALSPLVAQIVEKPVPGDPIALDTGMVAGKILPSGVKAYLGVPFAAPSVQFRA
jgi:para-nitrobenzyl esterase